MSDKEFSSYKISELEEKIKDGDINAINKFWEYVKKHGAPLIEKVHGDKENVLVTYIYKQTEPIENILIFGSFPGYNYEENLMKKLLNTNVWFKTYKVRNDVKFKYNFY
ncbi:esterase [Clostridium senegalense]|uniref:esterase n=1 Tax=Clostridium senegalense TaxID=1465809 RepID=UPI00028897E3|nr:esterase [Clostridium senegalense]